MSKTYEMGNGGKKAGETFTSTKHRWNPAVMLILLIVAIVAICAPFGYDIYRSATMSNSEYQPGTYEKIIIDDADLLSISEKQKVSEAMEAVTAYANVAVVTTDNTGGKSTTTYAATMLNSVLKGNGIVFLIDMQHRELYLYTDNGNTKLSVSKCNTITDNVFRKASKADYAGCISDAMEQITAVMAGTSIPQPMKHMSNLLLACSCSLLITFGLANKMTKIKKPGEVYQIDKNIQKNIDLSNVTMTLSHTSRYYNSSGGGSGGGHGGGFGGGGHGGGGHGGGHGF